MSTRGSPGAWRQLRTGAESMAGPEFLHPDTCPDVGRAFPQTVRRNRGEDRPSLEGIKNKRLTSDGGWKPACDFSLR